AAAFQSGELKRHERIDQNSNASGARTRPGQLSRAQDRGRRNAPTSRRFASGPERVRKPALSAHTRGPALAGEFSRTDRTVSDGAAPSSTPRASVPRRTDGCPDRGGLLADRPYLL